MDAGRPEAASPLDPTFGTKGATLTPFPCTGSQLSDALVKTKTGYVAGGYACVGWALVGYTANGTVDSSFGDAGIALLFTGDGEFTRVNHIEERADGRLVVGGTGNSRDFLRQLSANGTLDAPFNAAIEQDMADFFPRGFAFTLQPDGKLVIASGELVARFGADGKRDNTFGSQGLSFLSLFGRNTFVSQVRMRNDGRILIIGSDTTDFLSWKPFVALLLKTGKLDLTYAKFGVAQIGVPDGGSVFFEDAALQPTDAVVLAGHEWDPALGHWSRPLLWRVTRDGVLDPKFGQGGRAYGISRHDTSAEFSSVAALADGGLVVGGEFGQADGLSSWSVTRFNDDGALDVSFRDGGTLLFDVGAAASGTRAMSVVVDSTGYVLGGRGHAPGGDPYSQIRFGLARVVP